MDIYTVTRVSPNGHLHVVHSSCEQTWAEGAYNREKATIRKAMLTLESTDPGYVTKKLRV